MTLNAKGIVSKFITEVWNENKFDKINNYLHTEFIDHSLPPGFLTSKEGLERWIKATGSSFEHHTIIEDIVSEDNKVILKIKMRMKHIGEWRGIKPQGKQVDAIGYRYFKLLDNKIIEHWALIDGNAIENQLKETKTGCKIQK